MSMPNDDAGYIFDWMSAFKFVFIFWPCIHGNIKHVWMANGMHAHVKHAYSRHTRHHSIYLSFFVCFLGKQFQYWTIESDQNGLETEKKNLLKEFEVVIYPLSVSFISNMFANAHTVDEKNSGLMFTAITWYHQLQLQWTLWLPI